MRNIKRLYFDTETTGLDSRKHSIIQLGGFLEINGDIVEAFDYKLRPHPKALIEAEALEVNKLTEAEVMAYPEASIAFKSFRRMLNSHVDKFDKTDKIHLVGFNNSGFDNNFLRMLFDLEGDRFFGSYFWADSLDAMVLASEYLKDIRHTMPSFKLHRVAKTLGIETNENELHSAMYDAAITRKVYRIVTGLDGLPEDDELF